MAKHGAFNGSIVVNGVDLSDHCQEFNVAQTRNDIRADCMGNTDEYGMPGLKTGDITATFMQDFAAASVHATLQPIYASGLIVPVVYKPITGQAKDAVTNPEYSGSYYISNYRSIGGTHGEGLLAQVTFHRGSDIVATAT